MDRSVVQVMMIYIFFAKRGIIRAKRGNALKSEPNNGE